MTRGKSPKIPAPSTRSTCTGQPAFTGNRRFRSVQTFITCGDSARSVRRADVTSYHRTFRTDFVRLGVFRIIGCPDGDTPQEHRQSHQRPTLIHSAPPDYAYWTMSINQNGGSGPRRRYYGPYFRRTMQGRARGEGWVRQTGAKRSVREKTPHGFRGSCHDPIGGKSRSQ